MPSPKCKTAMDYKPGKTRAMAKGTRHGTNTNHTGNSANPSQSMGRQQPTQHKHIDTVGDKQTHIGWDRLLDGWLLQYWWNQQEKIWSQVWSRKSSRQWTSVLIQKLWDISWDMWDHRNKELHSGGPYQQQILHSAADNQITWVYDGRAQQLPQDALHLLRTPKETVLQYTLESKQLWLESVHMAQQWQQTHKFGNYISKQQFMMTWLQTAVHPNMTSNTQSDWVRVDYMEKTTYYRHAPRITSGQPCCSTHQCRLGESVAT